MLDNSGAEAPVQARAEPVEVVERVREVVIDGVAVMKIIKHCNEMLPTMVAGSLLGLDVDGVLEVTYTYAYTPEDDADGDGRDYQLDMMNMLRDVNIDNNCVGWYQSTYLSTMCTNDVVGYQYSYQSSDELSDNSVVIMYDPIQSKTDGGKLVMRAFRLTEEFVELRRNKKNQYIDPAGILEELPVRIKNSGYVGGFLRCLQDTHKEIANCSAQALSLANGESFAERNLELMNSWVDDLVVENKKFQDYARGTARPRQEHQQWIVKRNKENDELRENGELLLPTDFEASGLKPMPEAPTRTEPLLMIGQLDRYCDQVQTHIESSLQKIAMTAKLSDA
jgi:translation initiation factor 3 subunit H